MVLTQDDILERLGAGRFCELNLNEDSVQCYVFDHRTVNKDVFAEFLGDTFCDGFLDGYLREDSEGRTRWAHAGQVPFALAGVEGPDGGAPFEQQVDALLLLDLARATDDDCPILAIEIDGTADPEEEPDPILQLSQLLP